MGDLGPTDWNSRTIVEIAAKKKSDGWFFHAITGEAWLLKLKFRVARNTFQRTALQQRLPLKTLNEMDDLPVYSNEPRVRCHNQSGPWQEVELRLHSWKETDTPEMWKFLREAVQGFTTQTDRVALNPEELTPWKVLGEKWHYLGKGFPAGQEVAWTPELLKRICRCLQEAAPGGEFIWTNKILVHYVLPGQSEPWATLYTKRPSHLELVLTGPKGRVALGKITELGRERYLDGAHEQRDVIKLHFVSLADLKKGNFDEFLSEHSASLTGN